MIFFKFDSFSKFPQFWVNLSAKNSTVLFVKRKKNLIFWHPWDPWARVHKVLNKNSVWSGFVIQSLPRDVLKALFSFTNLRHEA